MVSDEPQRGRTFYQRTSAQGVIPSQTKLVPFAMNDISALSFLRLPKKGMPASPCKSRHCECTPEVTQQPT